MLIVFVTYMKLHFEFTEVAEAFPVTAVITWNAPPLLCDKDKNRFHTTLNKCFFIENKETHGLFKVNVLVEPVSNKDRFRHLDDGEILV